MDGLTVQTGKPSQTGTLCLGIPAEAAAVIQQKLASRGLIAKFPNRKVHKPIAPGSEADTIPLRISPNIYNSKDEIAKFFENLEAVLKLSQAS